VRKWISPIFLILLPEHHVRISTPLCRRKIAANNLPVDACHVMISAQFGVLMFVEFMLVVQSADFSLECTRKDASQYNSSSECRLEPCSSLMRLLCQAQRTKNDLNFQCITLFYEINLKHTYLVALYNKFLKL
jgi:hypothetical protein